MKIEYKVLWIDDELDNIKPIKDKISYYLEDKGIKFTPTEISPKPKENIIEDKEFITELEELDLDLILIDYNMSEGNSGNDIIKHIRNSGINYHVPIIFYSSAGTEVLIKVLYNISDKENNNSSPGVLDGIYFSDIDSLYEKTKSILDALIKKEEQAQRVRGLLMDKVSEIDSLIISILKTKIIERIENSEKTKELKQEYIIEKLRSNTKRIEETITSLEKKDLQECLLYITSQKHISKFTTHNRAELLRYIMKEIDESIGETLSNFINNGDKESLITIRNKYAHKTEEELKDINNQEQCVYIRKEIHRQIENIKKIKLIK